MVYDENRAELTEKERERMREEEQGYTGRDERQKGRSEARIKISSNADKIRDFFKHY